MKSQMLAALCVVPNCTQCERKLDPCEQVTVDTDTRKIWCSDCEIPPFDIEERHVIVALRDSEDPVGVLCNVMRAYAHHRFQHWMPFEDPEYVQRKQWEELPKETRDRYEEPPAETP